MWQFRMRCNLRPLDAEPVLIAFEVCKPIHSCFIAFSLRIRYVTP